MSGALRRGRRAASIFAVLSAMAAVVLDAGITNLALPTLSVTLGASSARVVLVVTAYQAGLMMALLPAGALGERLGYRRVFTAGVVTFALGSAGCALSPTLAWLVAARLVQGLGGAAVMALGVALLRQSVPANRLGAALGWNALTVALASAAAPSLGAFILSAGGWQALFAVNLPLAAATLSACRALPDSPRTSKGVDGVSMVVNALTFGLLISAAETLAADPRLAAALAVLGILALALLVRREGARDEPMIPLDLLAIPAFRLSAIASVCCFAAQASGLLALPFLLQSSLGQSPMVSGLYITAWPLSVALTAVIAGRLADRISSGLLCAVGATCLSVGLAGVASWHASSHPWGLIPFIMLCGVGFGLFQSPNNRTLFLSAPPSRAGAAGGMQGSARVSGQTLGAVMITLLFGLTLAGAAPRLGLSAGAVLALAAGLISLARTRSPVHAT